MLTQERLKEAYHYDPESGAFTRLSGIGKGKVYVGEGSANGYGYINISVDGKTYLSHRLAFLYQLGHYPEYLVDHINGIKHDNRWCNLRDVTHAVNSINSPKSRSKVSRSVNISRYPAFPAWVVTRHILGDAKVDYFRDAEYGGHDNSYSSACNFIKSHYYDHGIINPDIP